MLSLDYMGIIEGTDKSSLIGDYLRHYERWFGPLRDVEFNLIEIGVFDGASTRMWAKFFSRAQIIGVDINPDCRRHVQERVRIEIGSQDDPEFLHRIVAQYPPTIIIDDGSHRSDHIVFTFERLFPTLRPGGYYAVEDLHFHVSESEAARLRGNSEVTAVEYFRELTTERIGGEWRLRLLNGLKKYLVGSIERIEVVPQMVMLQKRTDPTDRVAEIKAVRPHVEVSNQWLNWLNYFRLLKEAGGPADELVEALRTALSLNPRAIVVYERLSEALELKGEREEAIRVLEQAVAQASGQSTVIENLNARIERLRATQVS